MKRFIIAALALSAMLVSCSKEQEAPAPEAPQIESVPIITAILPGAEEESTRTTFEYSDLRLIAKWKVGDKIAVTPEEFRIYNAGLYTLNTEGGTTADFEQTQAVSMSASSYLVCYPGDRVNSPASITRFSMKGQVQRKSAPMAHLEDYFMMAKTVSSYSTIDFSDAIKTACMRIAASGRTFSNPTKVELRIIGSGTFHTKCYPASGYFTYYYSDAPESEETSRVVSIDLEGYGTESELVCWLAMANKDVNLSAGDIVRLKVYCSDGVWYSDTNVSSAMTLTAGNCHRLTVDSGWKLSEADYTEYSFDGEVVTLQEAGNDLDLIIMGDGFIAADFDGGDSSTYMTVMKHAADQFFTAQPYIYLKPFFNIYVVKAVSPQRTNAQTTGANGARNTGTETKFSVMFTPNSTAVSGDDNTAFEYAAKALTSDPDGKRFANMTVIVIANQRCRAGTCWNYWGGPSYSLDYGYSNAIAYFGLGKTDTEGDQLVRHEASGHGFGKLADEYSYSSNRFTNTGQWNQLRNMQQMGIYKNVDCYVSPSIQAGLGGSYELTTESNVLWSDLFGTANNYESSSVESLGVFEGAYVFSTGFCRPTYDGTKSIMNQNSGIFNAISRRLILYRANNLMGTSPGAWGSAEELAWFLEWDRTNMLPNISDYLRSTPVPRQTASPEQLDLPFAPPVYKFGHFEGAKFVEEKR